MISKAFVKTLWQTAVQPESDKLYRCAHCYRAGIKNEQVYFISNGEPYCTFCVKGAK